MTVRLLELIFLYAKNYNSSQDHIRFINQDEILFCRSDNCSYLVNIDYVRSIDKKKKLLYLTNLVQIHFTTSIKDLLVKLIQRGAAIYLAVQHLI